jgi:hypothetical protein
MRMAPILPIVMSTVITRLGRTVFSMAWLVIAIKSVVAAPTTVGARRSREKSDYLDSDTAARAGWPVIEGYAEGSNPD